MRDFQSAQRRRMAGGELALEQLCAVVNNNVRCYDESLEFAEGLEDTLDDGLKGAGRGGRKGCAEHTSCLRPRLCTAVTPCCVPAVSCHPPCSLPPA